MRVDFRAAQVGVPDAGPLSTPIFNKIPCGNLKPHYKGHLAGLFLVFAGLPLGNPRLLGSDPPGVTCYHPYSPYLLADVRFCDHALVILSYTIRIAVNLEGDYGKSNQCASAASCGAARSAVARGEVGSSNYSDRVFERYGSIPESKPTDPRSIGGFAEENGAGTKGEMGKGWEGIATSSRGSENNWLGTCEAHHVSVGP